MKSRTGLYFACVCMLMLSMASGRWLQAAELVGADLYNQHCAACHGFDGTGGAGVPISLPSFLDNVSDDYIAKSIIYGRPGRIMPAFKHLTIKQVGEIVNYIRDWSPTSGMEFSVEPIEGDPVHGKQLYMKYCATCHGANGEGGHGTGVTKSRPRDFPIMAPALNNTGFLTAATDELIKHVLVSGREGTPMRSFLQQGMKEKDIDDVVSYIRLFETGRAKPTQPDDEDKRPVLSEVIEGSDIESAVNTVKRAIVGKNFRIIKVQRLNSGLTAKNKEDVNKVVIYFCNFKFLNQALSIDPRVGLFLPCRITVMKQNGNIKLATINPKLLSSLFNNSELDLMCDEMFKIYADILDESTL